jgi:glutamate synthase (NADPH/NADH) small chain
VSQLELLPRPPDARGPDNPWPQWPQIFRVSTAHEEGGERLFSVSTHSFAGDAAGRVTALRASRVERSGTNGRTVFQPVPGSEFEMRADLVLLAMGFTGAERTGLLEQFGVRITDRGTVWRDQAWMTSVPGVFTAGDMQRGQSLDRLGHRRRTQLRTRVDLFLMGESDLPSPLS